ncbi:putative type I restriction modification DNA specificity domain protein [Prevotella intermedia]|uniref:Putative type I restriction modification DNA specificity domain protein n=1 Tax=Prevotella intermedia TaxID=28131 RepID=A0A0T7APD4_PREIN|nr:restriction endonuclease subunit S [Prevotella intermedia]BAU18940.1 putative type I restriction modification DNA specificity domain protein [Prevotella intermedia]
MDTITYKIAEIGDVVGGGTPSTSNPDLWGGEIPWISPKDLTGYNSIYISHGENFLTPKGLKSGTKLLPKDTVLFSSRAPIGYIAIASNPICTNQGFKSIICNKDLITPLFLYYYIKANLDYIKLFGTGATFPEISGAAMKKIKIQIPSLPIQQKIASILSTYDTLIENNNRRIRLLEQMAENLYKEWFVRFRFPGHEKLENGLPKEWDIKPLKTLCEFRKGKNITASEMCKGTYPVISAGLSPSGFHNKSNVHGVSVTMSSSGANAGYISIHYDDIWAADCSYISEEQTEEIFYVYEVLNNIRQVINNYQMGAAQPHVYPKDINRIKTCIPPKELRIKANSILAKFHKEIDKLAQQNTLLTRQRDLLLPRLMSGKLEVKP